MSLPVLIVVVWVGTSITATAAFIAQQMLSYWLWERRQRRAMWKQVESFMSRERLPL